MASARSGSAWHPANWPMAAGLALMKLSVLLPQRLRLWLGARLGDLAWLVLPQRRLVVKTNLAACFPELQPAARAALEREHFREVGRGVLETPLALWGSRDRLAGLVEFEGVEHLERARAEGACLLLIAHVTMVELIGAMVHLISAPAPASITRDHKNALLDREMRRGRGRYVGQTLEKKDTRGMIRWLRGGGALFYAPDQDFSFGAEFVPFFGVPAATTTATVRLLSKLDCSLLPIWLRRTRQGRYQLKVFPPPTGLLSGDVSADTAWINRWIEAQVREAPAQYLWMHRRFRNRPPGEPPFYPPKARRRKHR
ncbi:MAG: lysophospholipid acyltransferase family protein [Pseudomonadota bacterium]